MTEKLLGTQTYPGGKKTYTGSNQTPSVTRKTLMNSSWSFESGGTRLSTAMYRKLWIENIGSERVVEDSCGLGWEVLEECVAAMLSLCKKPTPYIKPMVYRTKE